MVKTSAFSTKDVQYALIEQLEKENACLKNNNIKQHVGL